MTIRSYRDLAVWQKSLDLVTECYRTVRQFPAHERFGLSSQLQRAAVSVPANIAEGHAREHTGEYLQHVSIACGSHAELETHVEIARRLGYLNNEQFQLLTKQSTEIGRMLTALRRALRNKLGK